MLTSLVLAKRWYGNAVLELRLSAVIWNGGLLILFTCGSGAQDATPEVEIGGVLAASRTCFSTSSHLLSY
jgi:hypothetical protein